MYVILPKVLPCLLDHRNQMLSQYVCDMEEIHDIHITEFNSTLLIFDYSQNSTLTGHGNSHFSLILLFIQF